MIINFNNLSVQEAQLIIALVETGKYKDVVGLVPKLQRQLQEQCAKMVEDSKKKIKA